MPDVSIKPMIAVCTYNRRPSVHKGPKGSQDWRRDVYHLADGTSHTLCGLDTYGWSVIGEIEELDAHCCERCRAKRDTPDKRERR